jgi:MFS transporter, ACS family, D-galactonate transporter
MTPLAGCAADRVIARAADPIVTRKRFIVTGFTLASTPVIGAYTESRAVGLFCGSFSLAALGLAGANYWALTQSLVPAGADGRAAGLQNFASNFAGLVSPLMAGY